MSRDRSANTRLKGGLGSSTGLCKRTATCMGVSGSLLPACGALRGDRAVLESAPVLVPACPTSLACSCVVCRVQSALSLAAALDSCSTPRRSISREQLEQTRTRRTPANKHRHEAGDEGAHTQRRVRRGARRAGEQTRSNCEHGGEASFSVGREWNGAIMQVRAVLGRGRMVHDKNSCIVCTVSRKRHDSTAFCAETMQVHTTNAGDCCTMFQARIHRWQCYVGARCSHIPELFADLRTEPRHVTGSSSTPRSEY